MQPTTVILITGYPASGKTTLAHFLAKQMALPLLCKDELKEVLFDTLGWSTPEWSTKLGIAAWTLLYQQIEVLLEAQVDHIVEGPFYPQYANEHWKLLMQRFDLRMIQIRCECDPELLLERDRERAQQGLRHPGHTQGYHPAYYEAISRGPVGWIDVDSVRISVNTAQMPVEGYEMIVEQLAEHFPSNSHN